VSLEINHHLVAFLLKLSKSVDVHRSYDVPDPCHFYRAVLCIHCTSHGPVSNPSVRPSVTSRCSTKTAKCRITHATPHDSLRTLVF